MPPPGINSLFRNTPSVAPISHRAVLSVSGSQAPEFLNGLLATSVRDPLRGPFFSAFLHAQGRVLYDTFVYTSSDDTGKRSFLLEYDPTPTEAPPLITYLKRHVLRSKVKLRDVSSEYDVWAAWGSSTHQAWETKRSWNWARSGSVEPVWDSTSHWPWGTADLTIHDRRAVGLGSRLLVRKGDRPSEAATHDVVYTDSYILHRILQGVPEGSTDIPPMHAFPMDSNLDVMGGLDFRKGCYVGQELTVRTYHTGMIRKRILPVIIQKSGQSHDSLPPIFPKFPANLDIRSSVVRTSTAEGRLPRPRGTGKLLSSQGGVALALLRLEHVVGFQNGDLTLQFDHDDGETKTWEVSPWWPDWWPTPSNE